MYVQCPSFIQKEQHRGKEGETEPEPAQSICPRSNFQQLSTWDPGVYIYFLRHSWPKTSEIKYVISGRLGLTKSTWGPECTFIFQRHFWPKTSEIKYVISGRLGATTKYSREVGQTQTVSWINSPVPQDHVASESKTPTWQKKIQKGIKILDMFRIVTSWWYHTTSNVRSCTTRFGYFRRANWGRAWDVIWSMAKF